MQDSGGVSAGPKMSLSTASVVGFLANVLGFTTLMIGIYSVLTVTTLLATMFDERARLAAIQSGNDGIWRVLLASLAEGALNAIRGLWNAKIGFLLFGVLGAITGYAYRLSAAENWPRPWLASFVCMAIITAITMITLLVAQKAEISVWIADRPEVYNWRNYLLPSSSTIVMVGLILALTVTWPVWALWRWWYVELLSWTGLSETEIRRSNSARSRVEATTDAHAAHKLLESKRLIASLALAFLLSSGLLIPVSIYYNRAAIRMEHGNLFIDSSQHGRKKVLFQLEERARKIRVVNMRGTGSVNLYLTPAGGRQETLKSMTDWSFQWRSGWEEVYYREIPVADLVPGQYYLEFVQNSGWGYYEYALSHGGEGSSYALALAGGFLLGCSVLLGLVLVAALVSRFVSSSTLRSIRFCSDF